uniref:NADH-ubiquinone oxidoreductase chain 6 n=1 Tax=Orius niger TaxID=82746 RepID=B7SMI9_ORINI|nr:NADH dehydrogenase subunit 6 [Orius niger]ABZ02083.1 NADH dehydrogenase subunit 6 [Orius niger]
MKPTIEIMKIMLMASIMFMCMKHPLSMGLMLIIQTIIIAMITGEMTDSFWYSYILVISMVSGMLVLFIYMSSIASNEKFFTSTKMTMATIIMLMAMILVSNNNIETNMMKNSKIKLIEFEQMMNMAKMMSTQVMTITIMMVMYLLFTMIVVSHNTNIFEGPMRKKS